VFVAGADWFLSGSLDRRTLLKGASSAALGLLASAVSPPNAPASPLVDGAGSSPLASSQASAAPQTGGAAPQSAAAPASTDGPASGETAYVFNVDSKDVTLIDVASRQVRETRPLGSSVRWLSNEQTYWDGARIWTYDFPNDEVQAIAIDPKLVTVTKTIPRLGKGPGHSLVVLPGGKKAAINVAGDNLIAFLDLEHGQVDGTLRTGAFP
jgi:hypothetical protein